jgi:WD40 repeat protein
MFTGIPPEKPEPDYYRFRKRRIPLAVVWYFLSVFGIAGTAAIIYLATPKPEPPPPPFQRTEEKPNWPLIKELLARPGPDQEPIRQVARNIEKKILDQFPNHGDRLPFPINNIPMAGDWALSPDGRSFAYVDDVEDQVMIWDLEEQKRKHILHNKGLATHSLAFSPDGKTLGWAGGDRLRVWDMASATIRKEILFPREELWLTGVMVGFSPDGKDLAAYLPRLGNQVRFQCWDNETGRERSQMPECENVQAFAISPNGSVLALAKGVLSERVELWDYHSKTKLATFECGNVSIRHLAFSPDGKNLAIGGSTDIIRKIDKNPYLKLVHLDSGQEDNLTDKLANTVSNLSFSPDGQTLGVHQMTEGIVFFDLVQRKVKKHIRPPVLISHAQFFPGGSLFITIGRLEREDFSFTYGVRVCQVAKIFEAD